MNREKSQKKLSEITKKLYFKGWTEQNRKCRGAVLGVIAKEQAKEKTRNGSL